ncbi:MAG TPA: cobalamin-binding protein, partial [Halomonas sp.]|nr:cobalamin-binding protein [Halomonas sp.]
YAAGAGEALVGAVGFSDYPPEAQTLPRVGDYDRLDSEAMVALEPDLIVAWHGGNPRVQLERLSALGLPVYYSDAQDFAAIAHTIERLGRLTGHEAEANTEAQRLRDGVAALEQRYRDAPALSVFYQVWDKPLMTVSGEHWISQSLALCGGKTLFADADALVPRPSIENVLAADPDVIITGGRDESDTAWSDSWRRFTQLRAVQHDSLFVIDPDLVQRATPRLLEGTRQLCRLLDDVRERR